MDTKQPLMNTYEAARFLGLSASTLNKMRVTGAGPMFVNVGRCVRYEPAALHDWIGDNRRRSTSRGGDE